MIKNTLPDKSGNSEEEGSLKKYLQHLQNVSTNVPIVGKDWLRAFYRLLHLRFYDSNNQWKNAESIFLHENKRNNNSYRFIYKFVFILFLSFLTNQKQGSCFQQAGDLLTENIFVFCLY